MSGARRRRAGARRPGGRNQEPGLHPQGYRADAWRTTWSSIVAAPILEYSPLLSDADLIEDHRLRPGAGSAHRHRPPQARQREGQRSRWCSRWMCPPWRRCWSIRMPRSARRRWSASSSRPKKSNAWHDAAGAARRPVGPRHPPHRRLRGRGHPGTAGGAQRPRPDATRIHLNRRTARAAGQKAPPTAEADSAAAGSGQAPRNGRAGRRLCRDMRRQAGQREIVVLALAELAQVPANRRCGKILSAGKRQAAGGAGLACPSVHARGVQASRPS